MSVTSHECDFPFFLFADIQLKLNFLSEIATGRVYFSFEIKGSRKGRREEISFYLTKNDVVKVDEQLLPEFVHKVARELANSLETRKSLHKTLESRRGDIRNPNVFRALKIFDSDGQIKDDIDWESLSGNQLAPLKVPNILNLSKARDFCKKK